MKYWVGDSGLSIIQFLGYKKTLISNYEKILLFVAVCFKIEKS